LYWQVDPYYMFHPQCRVTFKPDLARLKLSSQEAEDYNKQLSEPLVYSWCIEYWEIIFLFIGHSIVCILCVDNSGIEEIPAKCWLKKMAACSIWKYTYLSCPWTCPSSSNHGMLCPRNKMISRYLSVRAFKMTFTVFLLYLRSPKKIKFFADRKIGITPKQTENLEPNTKLIVYQYKYCTYRYMYFVR